MFKRLCSVLILTSLLVIPSLPNAEILRKKNTATTIFIPIYKNDGTIISGAAGMGNTFNQYYDSGTCTTAANTAIPVETGSTGLYQISLTAAQMNADFIVIKTTSTTASAVPTVRIIRTTIGDPHMAATTDDGGTINVTGGKVDGVVLTDTVTTYTGNTVQTGDAYAYVLKVSTGVNSLDATKITTARATAFDSIVGISTGTRHIDTGTPQTGDGYAILNNGTYGNSNLQTLIAAIKTLTDKLTFDAGNHLAADVHEILGVQADTTTAGILNINVKNWGGSTAPANTGDAYAYLATTCPASRMNKIDNLDATMTSRMATFTLPTNFNLLSIDGSGLVNITQAAADKAWGTATRVLTAGTNIALAKGSGVTGFNDITAASVWSDASGVAISTTVYDTDQWATKNSTGINSLDAVKLTTTRAGYLDNLNSGLTISSVTSAGLTAIWSANTRTLTSSGAGGATAQEVWEYAGGSGRTLSSFGFTVTPSSSTAAFQNDMISIFNLLGWTSARAGYQDKLNFTGNISTTTPAEVWKANDRILTAGTNIVLAKSTGITGFNDLSAADIGTALTSQGLTTARSAYLDYLFAIDTTTYHIDNYMLNSSTWTVARANKLDLIDAAITSRSTLTAPQVWADASGVAVSTNTYNTNTNLPTPTTIWAYSYNGNTAANFLYQAATRTVNVAVSPTDIQTAMDSQGFTAILANKINTNLDTTISSRLSLAGYTVPPSAATIAASSNWTWLSDLIRKTR